MRESEGEWGRGGTVERVGYSGGEWGTVGRGGKGGIEVTALY